MKEEPILGKSVLIMRDTTERPEGIQAGTLKLVGIEKKNIYKNFKLLLGKRKNIKKSNLSNPYGDEMASKKNRRYFGNSIKGEI